VITLDEDLAGPGELLGQHFPLLAPLLQSAEIHPAPGSRSRAVTIQRVGRSGQVLKQVQTGYIGNRMDRRDR
jgi:hypothetical protein